MLGPAGQSQEEDERQVERSQVNPAKPNWLPDECESPDKIGRAASQSYPRSADCPQPTDNGSKTLIEIFVVVHNVATDNWYNLHTKFWSGDYFSHNPYVYQKANTNSSKNK